MKSLTRAIVLIIALTGSYPTLSNTGYTLKDFSIRNQEHTRDDLLKMIKMNENQLDFYSCPNFQDHLFSEFLKPFQQQQFLKIETNSGKLVSYQFGKTFNHKDKEIKPRGFVKSVVEALKKIEATPTGQRLLNELLKSPYPLVIKEGMNRFDPRKKDEGPVRGMNTAAAFQSLHTGRLIVDKVRFDQFGSGGYVWWNPKLKPKTQDEDLKIREVPTFMALAHELYHAYDSTRGLLDRRIVNGYGYEFLEITEYRAVYFENKLREENGLYKRITYSDSLDPSKGKLLDQNGDPIWIPASCLQ